jgi:hypothetical protein
LNRQPSEMFQRPMIQTPSINRFHSNSITPPCGVVNTIYWLVCHPLLDPNQACSSTIRRREPSERSRRSGFAAAGDPVVSRLVGCVSSIVTWVSS